MKDFDSILDLQLQSMLERIETELASRRETILGQAKSGARELLGQARRKARERVAEAVAEQRNHWERSLRKADAALASRIRRKQQVLDRVQLGAGREQLVRALDGRWGDPAARSAWARAALDEAGRMLPPGSWQFEYPQTLDAGEASAYLESIELPATVSAVPVEDLEAGFRLRCNEACLDASVPGLTRQWDQIGARLLAEIQRQVEAVS